MIQKDETFKDTIGEIHKILILYKDGTTILEGIIVLKYNICCSYDIRSANQ